MIDCQQEAEYLLSTVPFQMLDTFYCQLGVRHLRAGISKGTGAKQGLGYSNRVKRSIPASMAGTAATRVKVRIVGSVSSFCSNCLPSVATSLWSSSRPPDMVLLTVSPFRILTLPCCISTTPESSSSDDLLLLLLLLLSRKTSPTQAPTYNFHHLGIPHPTNTLNLFLLLSDRGI